MSKTIVNTSRRIYYFDENYILHEITQVADPYYNTEVLDSISEGQFNNLYIVTNNYRFPKRWDGEAAQVSNLGGLSQISVFRAKTLEVNNSHLIMGNIAKYGSGNAEGLGVINEVGTIIDNVSTIIDLFGTTPEAGAKRFNVTIIWSDILRPEVFLPTLDNQAGDLDFDEDGYPIIRILKLSEFNVVYKERSVWLLIHVGLPFVYVKKFYTQSVGLLAIAAIVEINNVHYFVGHDFDIYRFDGVSLTNLSAAYQIKDYIKGRIDSDKIYQSHAFVDLDRKEIQFSFLGKQDPESDYLQFDIVYNYEKNIFSKRDSVARCGGYFEQTKRVSVINDELDTIDSAQSLIHNYGVEGVPKRKLLIGDREGKLYLYNTGESFDGKDIYAHIETGDEDYAEPSRNQWTDMSKLISSFTLLVDNLGITKDFEFYIGTKDYMHKPIKWKGPFTFKQNAEASSKLLVRGQGVFHRFRLVSKKKDMYIRILGYESTVDKYGQVIR